MTEVLFKGQPTKLKGNFPRLGDKVANFVLATNDLQDISLNECNGNQILLSIFPSLDTPTCSQSVIRFNSEAAKIPNTQILCISKDLPFAQLRFCGVENINNAVTLSAFRNSEFGPKLGIDIEDGLLKGLFARAVILLNQAREVIYTELVPEITHAPNYEKCLAAMKA